MDRNKQDVLNNTHTYMNAAVSLMFTKVQSSRFLNVFGEIAVVAIVKELKN